MTGSHFLEVVKRSDLHTSLTVKEFYKRFEIMCRNSNVLC